MTKVTSVRRRLIKDQQCPVLVAKFTGTLQEINAVYPHSSSALQQRLNDEAVQLIAVIRKRFLKVRYFCGNVNDILVLPAGPQDKMIVLIVSGLHRPESVAVI